MKAILILAISFALVGCNERVVNTNVSDTVRVADTIRIHDTVKTPTASKAIRYSFKTVIKTNIVRVPSNIVTRDTNISKIKSSVVVGKVTDKESKSSANIVVCSEKMATCSKSNSIGVFKLAKPVIAGRMANVGVDTVTTPESQKYIVASDTTIDTTKVGRQKIEYDTTTSVDTLRISDTTAMIIDSIVIDSIIKSADSTIITVNIKAPDTISIKDTLVYVDKGIILANAAINSWGAILPENYIVQRDISAIDSTWDGCIRKVEAVYFLRGDSVAKVVTLGNVGKNYTGFIYTLYNDSSYRKDDKIYNIFLRGKNDSGKVVVKTDVETFSEKFGDIPTKILRTKVGVREYEIVPRFIPAAKNNEKLKVSSAKYSEKIDSTDWIGIEAMPNRFQKMSYGIYGWGEFVSVGIDSVSFDIETDADSINIPQSAFNATYNKMWHVTIPNTQTHYKVKIDYNSYQDFWIQTFDGSPCVISNVRFYFKKK